MKQCFVIMPYGGDDEVRQRHFNGVYQSIIIPAIVKAGLTPKRSDIAGEPGNITHDIIRDLANADIVIADLTTGNANVFFELGIRHAFRKSGTVHIIDATHELPFDVKPYRAIDYCTELAEIPQTIDRIAEGIKKRLTQPERPDNPVHDAIPELPQDIRSTGDAALQEQVKQLQHSLETLQTERDSLEHKLRKIDPSGVFKTLDGDVNVAALLDEADEIMKSTGENVLLRLRDSLAQGGPDAFARQLRLVLRSEFLDTNDYIEIVKQCMQYGLEGHRRATLEIARQRLPHSEPILLALADAYDDSPNPQIKERGRLMLEQYLSVEHQSSGPVLTRKVREKHAPAALGLLFNFYNKLNKPEWILSITESVSRFIANDSMILRNRARALYESGRADDADAMFKQALALDPTDDQTISWYADYLDDIGRYEDAYAQFERAICADSDDGDLYANLGIFVLNRGYIRDASHHIVGPVARRHRLKFAIPFLIHGSQDATESHRQKIVGILVRADALDEAKLIAQGVVPSGTYDATGIEHVQKLIASSTEQHSAASERDEERIDPRESSDEDSQQVTKTDSADEQGWTSTRVEE